MATTVSLPQSARQTLSTSALNSLANVTYTTAGVITHTTNDPLSCLLEVKITPGTVSGNKQVVMFAQGSLDGTAFESGPTSGTTTTDEPNLRYIGTVPVNSNTTAQTRLFDMSAAYSGVLPYASRIVAKNDSGASLGTAGNEVYYAEITGLLT